MQQFDEADVILMLSAGADERLRAMARQYAELCRDAVALCDAEARRNGLEGEDVPAFVGTALDYFGRLIESHKEEMTGVAPGGARIAVVAGGGGDEHKL